MCYMISRNYTCGHLLNVEFMYCTKYESYEKPRCCLTLGKPDADIMPHACKKCIDKKMNDMKPFEKVIMWDKCRRLWKKELEEFDRKEAEQKAAREEAARARAAMA
ncbi:hypothetical protein JOM56_009029 [Amanita muscaria]